MFVTKKNYSQNNIDYIEYSFFKIPYLKKEISDKYRKIFLFNICISFKKFKPIANSLNLIELFSLSLEKSGERVSEKDSKNKEKVDIVIPVYNGFEYLDGLFESIRKNTYADYRLIVINDCSTDSRVLPLLEKYKDVFKGKMLLICNEKNLGFVKTVNKGLSLSKNNVIILNTDTEVIGGWVEKLLNPILDNEKTASVTPFSNAATIFSLPKNCTDNKFEGNLEKINNYISKLNGKSLKIGFPTGMGFCMAMSKKALQEVGLLDEIFAKGYAEENDWCQRAVKKGYVNVIAPNLFVWHKHGGSFNSKEKQSLIKKNINILKKRYPDYLKNLKKLMRNPDYLSLRFFAELLYLRGCADYAQIWFDHTWGCGAEKYTFSKIEEMKNSDLIIRVQSNHKGIFIISYFYKQYKNKITVSTFEDLEIILKQINPNLIVVNNLASYKNILETLKFIEKIKNTLNIKISFRMHDYQCICPAITMVNAEKKYCNAAGTKECLNCSKNIKDWQKKWFYFLNNVDEIIVFSNSTKSILLKFYPEVENKVKVIPHSVPLLREVNVKPHKYFNIGVLGRISEDKGLLILKEIDKILPKHPDIRVKIIGTCSKFTIFRHIKVLGKYEVRNLPDIIEKEDIDIIFIPSIWPETFSYTTSEAMSMGVSVACFDIGAPAERITAKDGCVIPEINAKTALEEIRNYLN